ncbi:MAG: PIN domain-containing protein [Terracidiphilus sp.]
MRTAIDANVFSAIWSCESSAERVTVQLGEAKMAGSLAISPFVFAELLAYPRATEAYVRGFLEATGVDLDLRIEDRVWTEAGRRFARYAARRRQATGQGPRRLLADFLIGAHALVQADRLLTLDPKVYRQEFPELRLLQ